MKLFNTLSRKKEEFKEIKKGHISLYSCGPTVYFYAHIGNFRAVLVYDLLKRYLKYKGYKVKHVMNITDVDDKTINGSKNEKKSLKDFTEFYTAAFLEDIDTLNIKHPDVMPKATEEIQGMVDLIKELLKKEIAYITDDGIYFSISKFKNYGKLAKLDIQNLKDNADGRLEDEYEKENARDFALWKSYTKDDGDVFWDTEIGKGRPGWHIECSAMSSKYLGQPFDIHMGGIDLIFPHHTNEIAQSECAYEKTFCNYWVHNAHLIVNGEKMSKSLGNFFTLRDLLKKGHSPNSIRYELISTHYRQRLDFREDKLKDVNSTLDRFKEVLIKLDNVTSKENNKDIPKLVETVKKDFEKAMDDDLNISAALSSIFNFIREINKLVDSISTNDASLVKATLLGFDSVLGVMDYQEQKIPKEVIDLANKRLEAKNNKNFDLADKLRDEIKQKGYSIDDQKDKYILKKL